MVLWGAEFWNGNIDEGLIKTPIFSNYNCDRAFWSLFFHVFFPLFSLFTFLKPVFGHGGPRDECLTSGIHKEREPQCNRNKWSTFSVYNMPLGWSAYSVSSVKLKCMRISQKMSYFQFMLFPALHQVLSLGVCSWIRFSALHQASHCSFIQRAFTESLSHSQLSQVCGLQ